MALIQRRNCQRRKKRKTKRRRAPNGQRCRSKRSQGAKITLLVSPIHLSVFIRRLPSLPQWQTVILKKTQLRPVLLLLRKSNQSNNQLSMLPLINKKSKRTKLRPKTTKSFRRKPKLPHQNRKATWAKKRLRWKTLRMSWSRSRKTWKMRNNRQRGTKKRRSWKRKSRANSLSK